MPKTSTSKAKSAGGTGLCFYCHNSITIFRTPKSCVIICNYVIYLYLDFASVV